MLYIELRGICGRIKKCNQKDLVGENQSCNLNKKKKYYSIKNTIVVF